MTPFEKIVWIEQRACQLSIECHDNRGSYRSVKEWLLDGLFDDDDFPTPEVKAEAIAKDRLITVRCYPSTPVGSYVVCHHDLAAAIEIMFEWVETELSDKPVRT
jgi:hypothetical protein